MAKIGINIATGSLQKKEMIVGIDLGTRNSLVARNILLLLFLWLLPVFFVLHGLAEHFFYIPIGDAVKLILLYWGIEVMLVGIFYLFFRDYTRSALAAFITFFIYLFFGALHDFLKSNLGDTLLSRYIFVLPFLGAVLGFSLYLIRKKWVQTKVFRYMNLVFIILILVDLVRISLKVLSQKPVALQVEDCKTCQKPDVYLIMLDEYAGQQQLQEGFGFDNSPFVQQLRNRKFHVIDSNISNYSQTPFSVSSFHSMDYHRLTDYDYNDKNLNYCYKTIARSTAVRVFQKQGYDVLNYSIFDIQSQPSRINKTFLVSGINLITSQTLWGRVKKDLYNNLLMNYFQNSRQYRKFVFADLENNEALIKKTLATLQKENARPRLIYTHLMMPHFPYYYDSLGKLNDMKNLKAGTLGNKDLYLGYLKYCNTRLLEMMDTLIIRSRKPPVILLLSDHGFRYLKSPYQHTRFMNFAAIYLPGQPYKDYPSRLSNVNHMRLLFNILFEQDFPLLEDKSVL